MKTKQDVLKSTNRTRPTCSCGGELAQIDAGERSTTARCLRCGACFLVIKECIVVTLRDFHVKRALTPVGESWQRPLDDLAMARKLIRCLAN